MHPSSSSSPSLSHLSLTRHPHPVLDLPLSPLKPSPSPAPAHLHPSDYSITSFHSLTAQADHLTISILKLLTALVSNAQQRVATVSHLNQLRLERDTLLQLEFAAQQRSRELLTTCRREMALQESWTREIEALYQRAEGEGVRVDVDVEGAPRIESEDGGKVEWEEASKEWSTESKLKEEREELYRRQLAYLTSSLTTSSHRTSTLLSRLSTSSTSLSTRAELARLHSLTRSTSASLDQLAVEREDIGTKLETMGRERERAEEETEGWVLEWVLGWEEDRRDARRKMDGV